MSAGVSFSEIVGTAAAVVGIGGGALGLYQGARARYRQSIGSRRILAARLNQLAAGVTTRWVEERFGPPTFVRGFPLPRENAITPATGEAPVLRELIYRAKHAWIQILTDENDAVARFAITVTDPKFRFQVGDLTFYQLHARLGASRFSDVQAWGEPDGRSLDIAARRREYAESYWFGNPGGYQHYILSHNDSGTGKFDFGIERAGGPGWCQEGSLRFSDPLPDPPPAFNPQAPYARQFRAGTTVNTLTVLSPRMPPTGLAGPRGPDTDQVRVLVPGDRERRQMRRRIRQAYRQAERERKVTASSAHADDIPGSTTP